MTLTSSEWPEWASNFYYSPFKFYGEMYDYGENAFQAYKTLDPEKRKEIRLARTPGLAKELGRKVKLRPDWESVVNGTKVKDKVMYRVVQAKYAPGSGLAKTLIAHQGLLIEFNTWDDEYWGVCIGCKKYGKHPPRGLNRLGELTLQWRDELIQNWTDND